MSLARTASFLSLLWRNVVAYDARNSRDTRGRDMRLEGTATETHIALYSQSTNLCAWKYLRHSHVFGLEVNSFCPSISQRYLSFWHTLWLTRYHLILVAYGQECCLACIKDVLPSQPVHVCFVAFMTDVSNKVGPRDTICSSDEPWMKPCICTVDQTASRPEYG